MTRTETNSKGETFEVLHFESAGAKRKPRPEPTRTETERKGA